MRRVARLEQAVPGLKLFSAEDVKPLQYVVGELDRRSRTRGDDISVCYRWFVLIQGFPPIVGRSPQVLQRVARVAYAVQHSRIGQTEGGAADGSDGHARCEKSLRLLCRFDSIQLVPEVCAWQDQHRALGRLQLSEGHVRQDADSAHGRHRLSDEA